MTDKNKPHDQQTDETMDQSRRQPLLKPVDYTQHHAEIVQQPVIREIKWDDLELQLKKLDQQRQHQAQRLQRALQQARGQARFELSRQQNLEDRQPSPNAPQHDWQVRLNLINATLQKWFQTTSMVDELYLPPTMQYRLVATTETTATTTTADAIRSSDQQFRQFFTARKLNFELISLTDFQQLLAEPVADITEDLVVVLPLSAAIATKAKLPANTNLKLVPWISEAAVASAQFVEVLAYPESFYGAFVETPMILTKIQRFLGNQLPITVLSNQVDDED